MYRMNFFGVNIHKKKPIKLVKMVENGNNNVQQP